MTAPDDRSVDPGSSSRGIALAVLALVLVAMSLILYRWEKQKQRAVQDLPAAERQSLYLRTLQNFRTVCAPFPKAELKEHCQQDAEFLELFPECDSSCKSLVADLLRKPTR